MNIRPGQSKALQIISMLTFVAGFLPVTSLHANVLFDSDRPLAITLVAPLYPLEKSRDKSQRVPAELRWDERGEVRQAAIEIELRGNYRLKKSVCRHPPLRLLLDAGPNRNNLFAKQKRLKLVTQCRPGKTYLDYLRQEYLIYKAFALLTPTHFRVRWVDITYVDGESTSVRPGFLIEQKRNVAKRLQLEAVDKHRIDYTQLDPMQALLTDLFQYMVGNVDYSILKGEADEDCCHNSKLLQPGNAPPYYPIPYDFDHAGLVNAKYAVPNGDLRQTNVRQRIYRGFCEFNNQLDPALDLFLQTRDATLTLFSDDPVLSRKANRRSVTYLNSFYSKLGDAKWRSQIPEGRCRG